MRAIRSVDGRFVLDDRVDPPEPGPGEVLVRPTRVAIGRDELGSQAAVGVPGRRFVGVIHRAVGDELRAGQRVVVKPHIRCGRCDLCRGGLGDHCREGVTIGSAERQGCLAELIAVPAENVVHVPDALDDDQAVFAWTLAGALHVAQLLRVDAKTYVTVLGDNATGLLCAQWLARLNASVRLLGSHPARFGLCEKWGVKHRNADDVGRRADQDAVIDCTGSAEGIALAMRLVRPRGTIVLRGGGPGRVDLAPIIQGEITLVGSRAGNLRDAVRALAERRVDVLNLISRRVRLLDVPDVLSSPPIEEQLQTLVEL